MDHMLRGGYNGAAAALASASGIQVGEGLWRLCVALLPPPVEHSQPTLHLHALNSLKQSAPFLC